MNSTRVTQISTPTMEECCRDSSVMSLHACVERVARERHVDDRNLADTLLAMVDATQAALDRGKTSAALIVLGAFTHALDEQTGRHVEPECGEYLRQHADHVIRALGS